MRFNIPGCHAFCVHRQDLLLYVLADAGLVLLQQLRLIHPFPVSGNGDVHLSKTGSQRLGAMAVPAVICLLVPVIVLAVAKFL